MSEQTPALAAKPVRTRVLSNSTFVGIGILVALAALCTYGFVQMYSDTVSDAVYSLAYWYGTALQTALAVIIIAIALRIGVKESVGKQWLLIGLGVAVYAMGDITWTILDLHLGLDPYPSLADVFYFLEYAFFFAAIILAIRSYRALTQLRTPVIVSAVVSVFCLVLVYVLLLAPYILPAGVEELGFWGLVVSAGYPVCDVLLMLAPAIALALIIRQLGAGRLAWPWWLVVAGAFVFAIADSLYSYVDWAGTGSNPYIDMGWILANLCLAIGALIAKDVYRTH